jgi:hypothetical protein
MSALSNASCSLEILASRSMLYVAVNRSSLNKPLELTKTLVLAVLVMICNAEELHKEVGLVALEVSVVESRKA